MPEKIKKEFEKQYGKEQGERIFYATAAKQNRDPETFEKKDGKKKEAQRKEAQHLRDTLQRIVLNL